MPATARLDRCMACEHTAAPGANARPLKDALIAHTVAPMAAWADAVPAGHACKPIPPSQPT